MMAASVAVEAGGRFERVHHEAIAGACAHDGEFLGTGATGRGVGHLKIFFKVLEGRKTEKG